MATRLGTRNSEVNALEQRGYLIGKKIGQGCYATVHLAEYIDGTNSKKMRLACKIFDKEKAPHDFLDKFFPRELEILTKIENPHIIQMCGGGNLSGSGARTGNVPVTTRAHSLKKDSENQNQPSSKMINISGKDPQMSITVG
ncbi:Testis-specific serine/threonine-protein kinase 6 [Camponotus floridanus]|uniref:Testis-specific serine/threonine-protein kinase 6 n=1 Tax=Camponotus floridanus TaxID=104421 RepID=E2AH60_CAMFO|nr:Testis-specific serine/threonine-protein kinase 6 [Camponotus floridanus]